MSKLFRGCLIGIFAWLSILGPSQAANALVVSPSGDYTTSSWGSTLITFNSTGQTLTCTSSQINATISSTGIGVSPAGGALYRGCSNSLIGSFTITQTSAWGVRVLLAAQADGRVLVGLDIAIPARGVQFRGAGGCVYTLSGSLNLGRLSTGPLPVAITTTGIAPFSRTVAGLRGEPSLWL